MLGVIGPLHLSKHFKIAGALQPARTFNSQPWMSALTRLLVPDAVVSWYDSVHNIKTAQAQSLVQVGNPLEPCIGWSVMVL
jgi:hypothetical protein